jgi:hypothetical protein
MMAVMFLPMFEAVELTKLNVFDNPPITEPVPLFQVTIVLGGSGTPFVETTVKVIGAPLQTESGPVMAIIG